MAARKNLSHHQKTRERIQASMLVNRLQDNALGKVEMTREQIQSAKILLGKCLPDLKMIEGQIDVGGELRVSWGDPHSIQSETVTGTATSEPE